jgi:hypothetical protein
VTFAKPTDTPGQPLNVIYAEHILQLIGVLTGQIDGGALQFLGQVAAPATAPTVTLSAGALNGSYEWGTYWITGAADGTGSYAVTGRTTPSPYSTAQALANQQGTVSIAGQAIPTGVVGWGVVRNQAGGGTWYEVPGSEQFMNNAGVMPTSFVDNVADGNLVTAAPATNTTGTYLSGYLRLDGGAPNPQTVLSSVKFGAASGGTYNGNIQTSKSDQYPALQWFSGTTLTNQIIVDVNGKIVYIDGEVVFRKAPNGAQTMLVDTNGNMALSGDANVYGLSTSVVGTFLFADNTGNNGIDILRTDGSNILYLLPWGKGTGANTTIDTVAIGTGGGTANLQVGGSIQANGNPVVEAPSGGTKIQSGAVSVGAGSNATATVTFPTAFSTTPVVVITPQAFTDEYSYAGGQFPFAVQNISSTGFQVIADQNTATAYSWIAIAN